MGDFAAVASKVLASRLCKTGNLTIAQVNDHLDVIALANANKENGTKKVQNVLCKKTGKCRFRAQNWSWSHSKKLFNLDGHAAHALIFS